MIRINWKHVAVALAVLPVAAVLFAWIGFFNVGASTGHWKVTDWFLHFAMRSAVRTYALAVDEPERLPVEAIKPAAGHFARGCAICHGAPGEPRSPATLKMLPLPPDLASVADEWEDAELFRIVKHGVRFTGMPAWPTLRPRRRGLGDGRLPARPARDGCRDVPRTGLRAGAGARYTTPPTSKGL